MLTNFFSQLFDMSFTQFITNQVVKILYIIAIVFGALVALSIIISGLSADSAAMGLLALIFGPLIGLLYILFARVGLELIIVAFRIAENTGKLVQLQSRDNSDS